MSGKAGRKKQLKTMMKDNKQDTIQFIFKKWIKVNDQIILFGENKDEKLTLVDADNITELEGGMFYVSSSGKGDFLLDSGMSAGGF